ncbi:prepilin-type N-terminal cleavage/methylation domain-containing protein [Staphylococcus sp. IVB6181]|uniref:competence type IV pilus major pilin ComGC n=1 Tax=Staphylococcus sp. IVB6181 TaxID=2929481 RepID=UPI0021CECA2F|nr:competence type IV pilus major pilin ComGC [Staphylococcus sp. IVB6181]UXV33837.1 prepilin-type N-terminal cleavage/methylation domain-containing protein [Staphylococcus sp. IVB6181]
MKKLLSKLKQRHFKAFTLLEMMLVLLVISVLLILIIPNIAKQSKHVQDTGCEAQQKMVNSQIEAFSLNKNRAPSSIDELVSEGFLKEGQKTCKSGKTISISDGEAKVNE